MSNGTQPNVHNPSTLPTPTDGNPNHGPLLDASTAWTVALTCITVAMRFWSRIYLTNIKLWWDDWFILAACIATVAGMSLDCVEVHYGFGRHEAYLTKHQLDYFLAYTYGEWIQTFFTLMCTKVSINFFLLRIPSKSQVRLIRPLQVSILVLIVSNIILTILWCVQCQPVQKAWDSSVQGHCWSRETMLNIILAQAIISVVSDFAFAFYPILLLWNVKMNWMRKLGLRLLMGLGIITGVCCIVRTVLNSESIPLHDLTFGGIVNWFWRLFEVQLGIIAACIPTLVPVYRNTVAPVWRKASRRLSSLKSSRDSDGETQDAYGGQTLETTNAEERASSEARYRRRRDELDDWDLDEKESDAGFFLALRSKHRQEDVPSSEHIEVRIPSPSLSREREHSEEIDLSDYDLEKGDPKVEFGQ